MAAGSASRRQPCLNRGEKRRRDRQFSLASLIDGGSRQHVADHMPVDVGQAAVDAVVAEREPRVVDPHQVQDRRVQVVAVGLAGGGLPGPGVALAVSGAALDAGAGEPGDRRAAVVVAAGRSLGERLAAELGAPDDQRVFQQAAGLQVAEQSRRSAGRRCGRSPAARWGCRCGCPSCSWARPRRSRPGRTARRARAAGEPAGSAGRSRRVGGIVEAVQAARRRRLAGQVEGLGARLAACGRPARRRRSATRAASRPRWPPRGGGSIARGPLGRRAGSRGVRKPADAGGNSSGIGRGEPASRIVPWCDWGRKPDVKLPLAL